MSRIAIISDIHSNALALDAVISDAESQDVDNFACLGDIVGYGPNPSECVTRVQELNCVVVKGNHDEYVTDGYDLTNFNEEAKQALLWTRSNLSNLQKSWLASLPYTRRLGRNTLVHASLDAPEQWNYTRTRFDASIQLETQSTLICFFGHTHRPVTYEKGESLMSVADRLVKIEPTSKYLINVGSVGQPRDGDTRASYVIFDRIERTVEFRRVEYDIESVVQRIRNSGLENSLAERLLVAS